MMKSFLYLMELRLLSSGMMCVLVSFVLLGCFFSRVLMSRLVSLLVVGIFILLILGLLWMFSLMVICFFGMVNSGFVVLGSVYLVKVMLKEWVCVFV